MYISHKTLTALLRQCQTDESKPDTNLQNQFYNTETDDIRSQKHVQKSIDSMSCLHGRKSSRTQLTDQTLCRGRMVRDGNNQVTCHKKFLCFIFPLISHPPSPLSTVCEHLIFVFLDKNKQLVGKNMKRWSQTQTDKSSRTRLLSRDISHLARSNHQRLPSPLPCPAWSSMTHGRLIP